MNSIHIKKAPQLVVSDGAILIKIGNYMKTRIKIVGRYRDKNFKLIEQSLNKWDLPIRAKVLHAGTSEFECFFHALRYLEKYPGQSDIDTKQPITLKMFLGFENPDDYA